ncbi:hypothetical protein K470DRAFT_67227 [Piedraia hortae CBS 480.64]|uniref:Uncharacterized protein n=1 Tax=Piedraia hortae CBS 480.64 TaxID=1314780 RepID=A0A6A7BYS3_9PEZI|nr:hypothetical protein K470DRAFT_67227 [Piedraia hortae CBS 480.64]
MLFEYFAIQGFSLCSLLSGRGTAPILLNNKRKLPLHHLARTLIVLVCGPLLSLQSFPARYRILHLSTTHTCIGRFDCTLKGLLLIFSRFGLHILSILTIRRTVFDTLMDDSFHSLNVFGIHSRNVFAVSMPETIFVCATSAAIPATSGAVFFGGQHPDSLQPLSWSALLPSTVFPLLRSLQIVRDLYEFHTSS